MKLDRIENFTKGWYIGDFEPSLLRTDLFEVGIIIREPGLETPHVHKIATEYNILISGTMDLNGIRMDPGTVFVIEPGERVEPVYHEKCTIVCVKTPSIPTDKYIA